MRLDRWHAARLYLGYAGRVNSGGADFLEDLGRLALFVDLPADELETIAGRAEEVAFAEGEWIIRQGEPQTAVYVIVDGEVAVVIDDEDRRVLSKGSFFGEVAVLLDEPASASIITRTPVTCLVIQGDGIQDFLVSHPLVTYRILKAEARRLKTASEWRT
jgi:CRP/FNR family transcriptional regulator, cyclic AMP receptor protein